VGNTGNIVETRIARASGHFGEWLQGRLGANGPIGLVSVQCNEFWVRVARTSSSDFQYAKPLSALGHERALALLHELGCASNGSYSATTNIEAGAGLGASTASLLAFAKASGATDLSIDQISKALVAVEGASDPLMYPDFDRLLWASREARILERLAPPPKFEILGGCWGNPSKTDPKDQNFPDVSDLVDAWKTATLSGEVKRVAEISTESHHRTTALRNRAAEPTDAILNDLGALGVLRAHTGSARGFLFKPGTAPSSGLHQLQEAGYSNPVQFLTGG